MSHPLLTAPQGVKFEAQAASACDLWLYDDIGGGPFTGGITAKDVVDALAEGKKSGAKHLNVRVNSAGGSVFDGLAIYSAIQNWEGPKTSYVTGLAASIASVIMLAADKVYAEAGAKIMVHRPYMGVVGNEDDLEQALTVVRQAKETVVDIYKKRTGIEDAEIRDMMAAETWMTAEDAYAKKFVTKILRDEREPVAAKSKWHPVSLRLEVARLKLDVSRLGASTTKPAPKK